MTNRAIKGWFLVHKWTGLVCTMFALMLCVTGLPLIFHDEIDAAFGEEPMAALPAGTPQRPLDEVVRAATALHPGERPVFVSWDIDRPASHANSAVPHAKLASGGGRSGGTRCLGSG